MLERRRAYNKPIPWTSEEESTLLKYLKEEDFNKDRLLSVFPNRSLASIRSKVRKIRIKQDLFGSKYREAKNTFTIKIASTIKPKVVFDAYAGAGHQTFNWIRYADKVFAAEKMGTKLSQFEDQACKNGFKKVNTNGNEWNQYKKGEKEVYLFIGDAITAAADIKVNKINIDLIDLDTCGSTLPTLPTFLILLSPKNVLITHGEYHSMRFSREDVLRRLFMHRDVSQNPLPLSVDQMGIELDKAVKIAGLRAHNETNDSFWLKLNDETWLGNKFHGMLRRHYIVERPPATADCINEISK